MSHFTVMIVGSNIEKQLAPFQENNMGDCPKEYLEFNDVEEEYRKEYEEDSKKEFFCASSSSWGLEIPENAWYQLENELILNENSNPVSIPKDKFGITDLYKGVGSKYRVYYELKDFKNSRNNVLESDIDYPYAELIEESDTAYVFRKIAPPKEIPLKKIYPDGFDSFIKDWAGYEKDENTGKYGYWENPNAKWDWFQIGGRWRGSLRLKENPPQVLFNDVFKLGFTEPEIMNFVKVFDNDIAKFNTLISKYGEKDKQLKKLVSDISKSLKEPGFPKHFLSEKGWSSPDAEKGQADQAIKKDIDIGSMEKPMQDKAMQQWDGWHSGIKDLPEDNKERQAWIHEKIGYLITKKDMELLNDMSRDEYIACKSSWSPYAVVWNGKWYEKGEMGWFGISMNEENDWNGQFKELWADIPDTEVITMVDCHI